MPSTGKRFASSDETISRFRRLEKKVDALKSGSIDFTLGGVTEELVVLSTITVDGDGHVTGSTSKTLIIVDGIIEGIE